MAVRREQLALALALVGVGLAARAVELQQDQLAARVAPLGQPVGVDLARRVVVGRFVDAREELVLGHCLAARWNASNAVAV